MSSLTMGESLSHLNLPILDERAVDVFFTYFNGKGGNEKAWIEGYTRKTIEVSDYVKDPIFNSSHMYYSNNLMKTKKVVEENLNINNQEIYLSTSPYIEWTGCYYFNDTKNPTLSEIVDSLTNVAAFGTFNKASAGITVHCTYNPSTDEITMQYKYYLIDFYDYSSLEFLQIQDAFGLARSFELYGICEEEIKWKKNKSPSTKDGNRLDY